ncbi:MAG: hypothetical protein WEA11_01105 [Acidimicrobiales bacterium]
MTSQRDDHSGLPVRNRTARQVGAISCAILFFLTFTLGVTAMWARMTVFDSARFSERADSVLDSNAVRSTLANDFTDAIINTGPSSLASFRTVIRAALDPIMETPAFRTIFRKAIANGHDSLFTRNGNAAVINLSEGLNVLAGSLQATNPDLATSIPSGSSDALISIGDRAQSLGLWRTAEKFTLAGAGFLIAAGVFALGSILLNPDRRRGAFALGIAGALSGVVMFTIATVVPTIAGSYASNSETERAYISASKIFVSDYRLLSIWFIGFGVVICAFATASAPHGEIPTITSTLKRLSELAQRRTPTSQRDRTIRAVVLMLIGLLLIVERDTVLPIVVVIAGAIVAYVGAVQLLAIVGRVSDTTARDEIIHSVKHISLRSPVIRIGLFTIVMLGIISIGAWFTTDDARQKSSDNGQQTCNGFAELCNKPLNEVAFLGAHNSMSTAADSGWLFYEQTKSIPAQLNFGVRALLVKTHYGISTTVNVTGANLVITDSLAELTQEPTDDDDQFTVAQQEQAKQLQSSVKVDPNLRDVYLCHVYCEYGATKFSTALGYTRQFLVESPDNVIMWFIGDYVSKADTEKALREAKLFDRVWFYDPSQPLPTLGELIKSNRNIIMLSEFSGAPPAWNVRGYGIFQDTPFTFPKESELFAPGSARYTGTATVDGPVPATESGPDDTEQWTKTWAGISSCAPNRGTPRSPLFQINHWVTPAGGASTVEQAKIVNSYDVLMPRVRDCMAQRNKFPTIIGVNFVETGDALRVVNELNRGG